LNHVRRHLLLASGAAMLCPAPLLFAAPATSIAAAHTQLAALEQADIVLMYFAPGTQSPITLLEFGLYARSGKLLVAAPAGYWRKGNLDITGDRYGVPRFDDLPALIDAVKQRIADQRTR
ncbi:MAG: nucleoside 2-deoxyribosyltransferase domain-containing protein, partial [Stenotrophomonas sp.]